MNEREESGMNKFLKKMMIIATSIAIVAAIELPALAEESGKDKIVWIVEPVYEWEDVQAVKDSISDRSVSEEYVKSFNSRAFFLNDSKSGMIDFNGNILLNAEYDRLYCANEGVYGEKDRKGRFFAADGSETIIPVGGDGYIQYWNEADNTLIGGHVELDKVEYDRDKMMSVESVTWDGKDVLMEGGKIEYNNLYRLVSKEKELVTDDLFEAVKHDASFFKYISGDYAIAQKDGLWGYIKEDGTYLIKHIYQDAYPFYDGIAAVKQNDTAGFIREDGTELFDFIFEETRSADKGLAWVKYNGKWGVIDVLKTAENMNTPISDKEEITDEDETKVEVTTQSGSDETKTNTTENSESIKATETKQAESTATGDNGFIYIIIIIVFVIAVIIIACCIKTKKEEV